ncbi:MAG: PDC sensor domain-containing protein, partial [Campylobacterota bacterium]|nr:PDC sensor domain-containing protein [Campylobacterota bacterium]
MQDFASDMKTNLYKGYDYSNTDYYLAIKNGADDFWSKVYLSNATNKSTISYTLRVDENTIAVLIVDLDYLHKFTKKFKGEDDTSVVRITDKNGIFLSHPSIPEYVSQRMSIKD